MQRKTEVAFHSVSEIFPLMSDGDLAALADDIKVNGLREPIWLYQGQILDGRNRYRACEIAGVEPEYRKYTGLDKYLVKFVLSLNLHRRHLTTSQRAMVAANIASLKLGSNQHEQESAEGASNEAPSQDVAASLMSVSRSAVQRAATVKNQGVSELKSAVESGEVSVSVAAEVAKKPKAAQRKAVAGGKKAMAKAAKESADEDDIFNPPPADEPWRDTVEEAKVLISKIRSLSRECGSFFDFDPDTKRSRKKYMSFVHHAGVCGNLNATVRSIEESLPARLSDKPPGYIPISSAKIQDGVKGGRAA